MSSPAKRAALVSVKPFDVILRSWESFGLPNHSVDVTVVLIHNDE